MISGPIPAASPMVTASNGLFSEQHIGIMRIRNAEFGLWKLTMERIAIVQPRHAKYQAFLACIWPYACYFPEKNHGFAGGKVEFDSATVDLVLSKSKSKSKSDLPWIIPL
jgi:hypothetical protein